MATTALLRLGSTAAAAMAVLTVIAWSTAAHGGSGRPQTDEEQVAEAMAELGASNPRVREKAADKLEFIALRCRDERILVPAVGRLIPLMDDEDPEVRDETAEVLGILASRVTDDAAVNAAIAALVEGLSDRSGQVREESAEALAWIAGTVQDQAVLEAAVEPLEKALGDDPATRRFAEQALWRLGRIEPEGAGPTRRPRRDGKRNRYLLLDSRIIEKVSGARLAVGTVKKHPANPLFGEEEPWEKRFDNLYPNVLFDPQDRLYKCWYNPFIYDADVKPPRERWDDVPYRPRHRELALCYAFSKDGIHWEKPELGIIEYEGSTKNNLVLRPSVGPGILLGAGARDPQERFRLFGRTGLRGSDPFEVRFSPDGIHWGRRIVCRGINPQPVDGTHYNALWVPELGEYAGFVRMRGVGAPDPVVEPDRARRRIRQVGRTGSRDFLHWTKARLVFQGSRPNLQTYSMPVFRHAGVYLGLPVMYDAATDRAFTALAWSPDTFNWQFVDEGTPLIPNGENEGDYDWGCVYSSAYPIFLEHEIRLYYGASNGRHFGWRDGFFCLATLRPDGFAAYEPVERGKPARVTTTPLLCSGGTLCLSADIHRGGYVEVAVLDEQGDELAEGEPITGTGTDSVVRLRKGFSLDRLEGKEIRLRFELRDARLYSFAFADPSDDPSRSGEHHENPSSAAGDGRRPGKPALPARSGSDVVADYRSVVKSKDIQVYARAALALRRWMIENDPHRPIYHFTGPEGWINDPNGPIYHEGKYHLFYQFDPMVPDGRGGWRRSARCWGHAVSDDLVHWIDWPVALWPDTPYDRAGVYSGNTVIDPQGFFCALYTGNVAGHRETYGMLARSPDGGLTWRKTMVMDATRRPNAASPVHWDGYVWRDGDRWVQLVGGTTGGRHRQGAAWLWASRDLEHWTLQNNIAPSIKRGTFWELPYLIPLGGRHVLLVGHGNPYWVGTYDRQTMRFTPDEPEPKSMDHGTYYSFNVNMTDMKGPGAMRRRLMHGWVTGPASPTKTVPYWQGAHSIPRVLSLRGTYVVQEPIPEIEVLRGRHERREAIVIRPGRDGYLPGIRGDALEIEAAFDREASTAVRFGLKLRVSEDGRQAVRIGYDSRTERFGMDGEVTKRASASAGIARAVSGSRCVRIRIFLDRSILEVYCGGAALTGRTFGDPRALGMDLFAEGGSAHLASLDVWEMRSMWGE